MIFLLFLLFSSLDAADFLPSIAHFEAGPLCTAGGHVNILSGAPLLSETDLTIVGDGQLSIDRNLHYFPLQATTAELLDVKTWDLNIYQFLDRKLEGKAPKSIDENFILRNDSQETLIFQTSKESRYDPTVEGIGTTNYRGSEPSSFVTLKGYVLKQNCCEITSGKGEKREYEPFLVDQMRIKTHHLPKGFKRHYHYQGKDLAEIVLESPFGTKVEGIKFEKESFKGGYLLKAKSTDGHEAVYEFSEEGKDGWIERELLKKVSRSALPEVVYQYSPHVSSKLLTGLFYPEGRGLSFTYWEKGDRYEEKGKESKLTAQSSQVQKVKTIEQPVKGSEERIATHLFQYFKDSKDERHWKVGQTRVTSVGGHVDDYFYDKNYQLKEVVHYSNPKPAAKLDFAPFPLPYICDSKERYFWNKGGEIKAIVRTDGSGQPYQTVHYAYDLRGNVVTKTLSALFKGEGSVQPEVDENGNLVENGCESLKTTYSYSNDDFNLLLSEKSEGGLEIRYSYLKETSLPSKQVTLLLGEVVKEELFSYDQDHSLIAYDEKTALAHRREVYTPSKETPFGFPIKKEVFGVSSSDEALLLETYHYSYDKNGKITREERRDAQDNLQYFIERQFDAHGNCVREKDDLGRETVRSYDQNDNCIEEVGPRPGLVKSFKYDCMDRMVEEGLSFEGETSTITHIYNTLGHEIETVNEFGHSIKRVFDRYGKVLEISFPEVAINGTLSRPVIKNKYDLLGNVVEATDEKGGKTASKYTANHQPFLMTHPDGAVEKSFYSLQGLPLKAIDADGNETSFSYDALGRLISKETADGVERYDYEGLHLVRKVDVVGLETHFSYDLFGRLVETKTGDRSEVLSYDGLGRPFRKAYYQDNLLLLVEVSIFDSLGRLIESYQEDPNGATFKRKLFAYDEVGNCIEETARNLTTVRTFDGQNRVTSIRKGDILFSQISYEVVENSFGQKVLEKIVVDPSGRMVVTTFDTRSLPVKTTYFDLSGDEILRKEIAYDLSGHVVKEEQIEGREKRVYSKEVNGRGRVTAIHEPLGKVTLKSYTPGGQLSKVIKPDGIELAYGYEKGRLASLASSDETVSYLYSYNARGELVEVFDELTGLKSIQVFSPFGELLEETLPTDEAISYAYDGVGRMTSYTLPDGGHVEIEYNSFHVTSISRFDQAGKLKYTHRYTQFDTAENLVREEHIGQAGTSTYTYNEHNELSSFQNGYLKGSRFQYDFMGNLLSYDLNGEKVTFGYDDLYQLTDEREHSYAFDGFGNRILKDNDLYRFNEQNLLLEGVDNRYSYDLNGRLLKIENSLEKILFSYDALDRLIKIEKGDETAEFTYDAFNRRLTRHHENYHFMREQEIGFRDELRIVGPRPGSKEGTTIAVEFDGLSFAPMYDLDRNIMGLIFQDGEQIASCRYTWFGELLGTNPSPWGFASRREEPITGFVSFGTRDYDPSTLIWTTPQ